MEALQSFLLILHIIVAVFIVVLILLQPTASSGGLVSSSTIGGSGVSRRSAMNFLSKLTMCLALFFMLNSLFLGVLAYKKINKDTVIEGLINNQDKNNVPIAE
jgi:preprotein translocase subunit SecG